MADVASEAESVAQVLIEIQSGDGLSLSAAGRLFPAHRGDGSVSPSTVFRWVTRGAPAATGAPLRLEAVRVGSRWLTSRGAVGRFVAALTDASVSTQPAPVPTTSRTDTARRRATENAITALEKMGA